MRNMDRLVDIGAEMRPPVVLFGEGEGTHFSNTGSDVLHGLERPTYLKLAALSGLAPTVAIVRRRQSGRDTQADHRGAGRGPSACPSTTATDNRHVVILP